MYSPLLILHIIAGITALLAGALAFLARKGSRLHRRSGDFFVVAMMAMGLLGAWIGFTKGQLTNVAAGTLSFYLVASGWLTVYRKRNTTGPAEAALMILTFVAGAALCTIGGLKSSGVLPASSGEPNAAFYIFGAIFLLCGAADARMLLGGGLAGARRLVRHIWRMGFAMFIATGSFFLGRAGDPVLHERGLRAQLFTPEVRATHLPAVPVLLVIIATIYWLVRVRFTKSYGSRVIDRSAVTPTTGASR